MISIIVTGGLGFIGSHIVERLVKKGFFPIIIDDFSNGKLNNLSKLSRKSFIVFKNDINEAEAIIRKISKYGAKTIIHLAAAHYIPFCTMRPKEVIRINVLGTKSIIEVTKKTGVENILFASSAAVYSPRCSRHRETDKLDLVDVYGRSKIRGEELVKESGLNYTVLRFFNVYGHRDSTPHIVPSLIKRFLSGSEIRIGNINTIRDYVYIDDAVNAIERVLDDPTAASKQIYNVGTGRGHSGADIINILKKQINKNVSIFVDRKLLREADRKVLLSNCAKIKQALSWEPKISFEVGINKTLKNFE